MKSIIALLALAAVSACAAIPQPTAGTPPPPSRPSYTTVGLERVLGHNAQALVQLFGQPDADLEEGPGRKLQFASDICVLDAYLYADQRGGVPTVRHIDARQRDGAAIDRASCVAALTRREGGR
ncbi:hypothetical protein [Sphingomonas japonica]|uniref:Uncharacterized protein n=1 Tax=Sphingomonas japonica TaxID=511662 RepID=A0ABX0TZI0_9SPHN|nr:hypothetical protein [Sphingomonas japonica]NIJ23245.1 hypothetical protein [Sphingomonas japonica]